MGERKSGRVSSKGIPACKLCTREDMDSVRSRIAMAPREACLFRVEMLLSNSDVCGERGGRSGVEGAERGVGGVPGAEEVL